MGTEIITFTAADPEGHFDTEDVSFTVDASPKISKINSQIIEAGDEFSPVNLDDFVNDLGQFQLNRKIRCQPDCNYPNAINGLDGK